LILLVSAVGGGGALIGMVFGTSFTTLLSAAFIIGGMTSPLYSLLVAYTNDYLEYDDMSAASGGLVFINGLGAIAGPVITGWLMGSGVIGPPGFFLFIATLMFAMAVYALYRMTQRAYVPVDETGAIAPIYPTSSPIAMEVAQEVVIEAAQEEQDAQDTA
jgi:MFS family permease